MLIKTIKYLFSIIAITCVTYSCTLPPMVVGEEIDPDIIVPDTTVIIDTCVEYFLITEPKFVTGYFIYEDSPFVEGLLIIGADSAYIHTDYDIETIIHDMLKAWKPQFKYQVFRSDDPWFLDLAIIAEGTNDPYEFRPYVRLIFIGASGGTNAGMGWHPQGMTFLKAVTFDECLSLMNEYPSVDYFTFIKTGFDSVQVLKITDEILSDCKAGRNTADFRYLPFEIPDSIINLCIERGWDNVLN